MAKGLITQETLTGIANAIRAKAGTSAAMRPDEMAALIQSISGGGKVAWGSFTPTGSNTSNIDITHNLGVVPNLIVIFASGSVTSTSRVIVLHVMPGAEDRIRLVYYSNSNAVNVASLDKNETNLAKAFPTLTTTTMTVSSTGIKTSIYFLSAKEYFWIAAEVSA